jgi:hypothetical protein
VHVQQPYTPEWRVDLVSSDRATATERPHVSRIARLGFENRVATDGALVVLLVEVPASFRDFVVLEIAFLKGRDLNSF